MTVNKCSACGKLSMWGCPECGRYYCDRHREFHTCDGKHVPSITMPKFGPLNYPGGKWGHVAHILPHLPQRRVYVECFGGSAAVLLHRQPCSHEVYNDTSEGVVSFFRAIRDHYEELVDRLQTTVNSRQEWEWCHDTWQDATPLVEKAARWYYCQYNSFAGLGRHFGRELKKRNTSIKMYNRLDDFPIFAKRFRGVIIEHADWRKVFDDFDSPDTVFYLDPPYVSFSRKDAYKENDMNMADHTELCETIMKAKGYVALSGYPNELYDSYKWDAVHSWTRRDILAYQHTNDNPLGDRGKEKEETLWLKY